MNEQNSILIDYDMRQVREGEYVAWQGQWWADPRHDDAVSALRLAEGSSEMRSRLGQAARQFIKSELSYEEVGLRMADYVGQLWHSSSVKSQVTPTISAAFPASDSARITKAMGSEV
jgi:hypothetical protein